MLLLLLEAPEDGQTDRACLLCDRQTMCVFCVTRPSHCDWYISLWVSGEGDGGFNIISSEGSAQGPRVACSRFSLPVSLRLGFGHPLVVWSSTRYLLWRSVFSTLPGTLEFLIQPVLLPVIRAL